MCGRNVALRKDGTAHGHGGTFMRNWCEGSWRSPDELDEIVEAWHHGRWPERELEQVIREHMSWDHNRYARWVAHGFVPLRPTR